MADNKMDDTLFEDVPFDDSLFEDTPYQEPETESNIPQELEGVGRSATVVALTKKLQNYMEGRAPKIRESAEERAFQAIGGPQSKEGRKIIEAGEKALDPNLRYITERDIGREALKENLLGPGGISPLKSKDWSRYKQTAETKRLDLDSLLKDLSEQRGDISSSRVADKYEELISPEQSGLTPIEDADILKKSKKEVQRLRVQPPQTIEQLEKEKRRVVTPDQDFEKRAPEIKAKRKTYAQIVEEAVGELGDESLEEFKGAKKAGGVARAVKEIGTETRLARKVVGPMTVGNIYDIVRKSVSNIQMKSKGAMATLQNNMANFLEKAQKSYSDLPFFDKMAKGVWKSAPILAGFAAYESAKASGLGEEEAIAQAVKEEIVPFPIEMLTESTDLGPEQLREEDEGFKESIFKEDAQTPAYKLESGTPLREMSPSERKGLGIETKAANFTNSSSEDIQKMTQALLNNYPQKAAPFINVLEKASEAPDNRRNALLFSLYQQPAFRKMLDKDENG